MKAAMGRSVVLRWLPECHPHLAMRIQGDHPRDGSSWIHGGLITSPSVTVPLASCEPDRSRLRADCERAVIVDGIWDSIWAYLDSTTVVASLHATSSLSFPQHRTPAFQAWLVHLRERSSRSGCKLKQVFSTGSYLVTPSWRDGMLDHDADAHSEWTSWWSYTDGQKKEIDAASDLNTACGAYCAYPSCQIVGYQLYNCCSKLSPSSCSFKMTLEQFC